MGRLFAAILILCGAILTFEGPVPAQSVARIPPTGSLYLSTLPSGADVWLDGAYVGTSPVLVDALSLGRHSLSVTKAGWAVKEVEVDISEQATAMESLRLEHGSARAVPATGTLAIRGVSGVWHAWVDGVPIGTAAGAAAIVRAGQHSLVVSTPLGKMTRIVTIYPDMTTNVVLRETPEARAPAILTPLDEALPDASVAFEKKKVSIKYAGHSVRAVLGSQRLFFDGTAMHVNVAPTLIGGKLYVPQELVKKLTGDTSKRTSRG